MNSPNSIKWKVRHVRLDSRHILLIWAVKIEWLIIGTVSVYPVSSWWGSLVTIPPTAKVPVTVNSTAEYTYCDDGWKLAFAIGYACTIVLVYVPFFVPACLYDRDWWVVSAQNIAIFITPDQLPICAHWPNHTSYHICAHADKHQVPEQLYTQKNASKHAISRKLISSKLSSVLPSSSPQRGMPSCKNVSKSIIRGKARLTQNRCNGTAFVQWNTWRAQVIFLNWRAL